MHIGLWVIIGLGALVLLALGGLSLRFVRGRRRADQIWMDSHYPKLKDLGTVKSLTVLPLIDWYTAREDLVGEAGVSYLVRADGMTILFDMGVNERGEHPSPLLRNMAALGVDVASVDAVFISHAHGDHMGGIRLRDTFTLSGEPVDLRGIPAYVPELVTNPSAEVKLVEGPQVIAPGVASTGPIPRQLFFFGWTPEQTLAVNVKDKGIVLIVGCGHSTVQRIVARAEMLFDVPIYGVIGGLHYPVKGSRVVRAGVPMQRLLGTGKWPWTPISRRDVETAIKALRERKIQLIALSGHDSCDWSLEAFRQAFGKAYRELRVGEEIVV